MARVCERDQAPSLIRAYAYPLIAIALLFAVAAAKTRADAADEDTALVDEAALIDALFADEAAPPPAADALADAPAAEADALDALEAVEAVEADDPEVPAAAAGDDPFAGFELDVREPAVAPPVEDPFADILIDLPTQVEAPAADEPAMEDAAAAEEVAEPAPTVEDPFAEILLDVPAQVEAPAADEPAMEDAAAAEEVAEPAPTVEDPFAEILLDVPAQVEAPAADEPAMEDAAVVEVAPEAEEAVPAAEMVDATAPVEAAPISMEDLLFDAPAAEAAAEPAPVATPPPAVFVPDPELEALDAKMADFERRALDTSRQAPAVAEPVAAPPPVPAPVIVAPPVAPVVAPVVRSPAPAVAPPPPVAARAAVEPTVPAELAEIARESRAKREMRILEAQSALDYAVQSLAHREWLDAAQLYKKAYELFDTLPDRQNYVEQRRQARVGEAEAWYRLAVAHFKIERLDKADNMAKQAMGLDPEHTGAQKLVLQIEAFAEHKKAQEEAEQARKIRDLQSRARQPEYRDKVKDVRALMRRGRQHYVLGEYDKAQEIFESVLSFDPFNTDALALREKVARRGYDLRSMEMQGTQQDMMRQVREAWRPADYVPKVPRELVGIEQGRDVAAKGPPSVLEKARQIIIPEMEFRQANLHDVIKFFVDASRQFAPETWTEQERRKGINLVLNVRSAGAQPAAAPAAPADPWGLDTGAGPDLGADTADGVTFSARFINLFEALRIITQIRGLKFRVEGDVIIIVGKDEPDGDIIVRPYTVNPNFMQRVVEIKQATTPARSGGTGDFLGMGETSGITPREDIKDVFIRFGVPFPDGSSIEYVPTLSKIFVSNTADNLIRFEAVLAELNVVPKQVEIEARFVDIGQNDLSELGLNIFLTDNWEVAVKKGAGPVGARERIVVPANTASGGFTKGLRNLFDNAGVASAVAGGVGDVGNLLTVQSLLTNPELSIVLHALEQSGNANLLSAPKVLTQAGEEASIKVVKEFIYPTEYQTDVIQAQVTGGGTIPVGSTVTPTSFETREVGVILTVLPEVSPEGHLITLTMTPQVVSGPEFVDYGSETVLPNGTVNRTSFRQPIFFTREVTTRVIIYDGSTVVMGGMITEALVTTDDKVPILGDLPILGRAFRSKTSNSEKRNLLVFVTAKLVDPSGKALGQSRPLMGGPVTGAALVQP